MRMRGFAFGVLIEWQKKVELQDFCSRLPFRLRMVGTRIKSSVT